MVCKYNNVDRLRLIWIGANPLPSPRRGLASGCTAVLPGYLFCLSCSPSAPDRNDEPFRNLCGTPSVKLLPTQKFGYTCTSPSFGILLVAYLFTPTVHPGFRGDAAMTHVYNLSL